MSNKWTEANPNPNIKSGQVGDFISNLEKIKELLEKQLQAEINNLEKTEFELKKYQAQVRRRKDG